MRTQFASVAEAIGYLFGRGYSTVAVLEDCRIMRRYDSCAIIEHIGMLEVVVKYS